ncbi:MAG: hypothetical protein ACI30A_05550 [Paludibacteraceae bacterium]
MEKYLRLSILFGVLFVCLGTGVCADKTIHTWRKTPTVSQGLYSTHNSSVAQGVNLTVNALYYYGDVDMLGYAFKHGFQEQNVSLGGSLVFSYLHPLANSVNLRFSLSGGYLHGNDSARYEVLKDPITGGDMKQWIGKGSFKSGFGELAVGVEWYPFSKAGFYIYGGLGLNLSVIDYDFTKSGKGDGQQVNVLPMLPVEIGYNFNLTHGFFLTIMASVHQGLLDVPHSNLDGYPLSKSSRFQWGDGYFLVGLSFSYRWQKCEPCRLYTW